MPNHIYDRPAHPFREELPIYAAALAIGVDAEAAVPGITAHLAVCPDCVAELRDLLELVQPAYTGTFTPAARYPVVDLSFLQALTPPPLPTAPLWRFDAGRLTIQFSHAQLAGMRPQPFAGAARGARGELLLRYTQEPGSVQDLDVSIEVYTEDAAQHQGRVRVGVDVASRSPLEQHGSMVTLYLGADNWDAETDETGCVDFAPVPLADLPSLRVEITPLTELKVQR
jgi:hypothetical protein